MANFVKLSAHPEVLTVKLPEFLASMNLIMMRMDREDEDHDRLFELMKEVIDASGDSAKAVALGNAAARFLEMCQHILKREWEVLKGDMHATPWGWPISSFVRRRKRRERAERVEINRRRRKGLALALNRKLVSIGRLHVSWKVRQVRAREFGEHRRLGRLEFWRSPKAGATQN